MNETDRGFSCEKAIRRVLGVSPPSLSATLNTPGCRQSVMKLNIRYIIRSLETYILWKVIGLMSSVTHNGSPSLSCLNKAPEELWCHVK